MRYYKTYEEVMAHQDAIQTSLGLSNVIASLSWKQGDGEQVYDAGDVILNGRVVFVSDYDEFWARGEGQRYESAVFKDPTYADLLKAADASILTTKDHHHCYLEGIEHSHDRVDERNEDGVPKNTVRVFRLVFGS